MRRIRQDSVENFEELQKYIVVQTVVCGVTLKVIAKPGKVHKLCCQLQKIFPLQGLNKPEQTTKVKSNSQTHDIKSPSCALLS